MKIIPLVFVAISSFIIGETMLSEGYQPGDKATDFNLKSVDGKNYSMSDYKDAKGFIVVLPATVVHLPLNIKIE